MQFKDDDIIKVYFGFGWDAYDEEQEYLGSDTYYQGVSRIVHQKIEDLGFNSYYIRWISLENGITVLDFGSHCYFFKLVKVEN